MQYLVFSILCYALGMGAIIYTFWFMEFRITGAADPFTAGAAVWNLLLFAAFPLQHSLMARAWWKKRMMQRLHPLMERPVYVGISGMILGLVLWFWKPLGPVLFHFDRRLPFDLIFFASVALITWTSTVIGHFWLFGLKHGIAAWKGATLPDAGLNRRRPFRWIRHPLTTLLIVAIWSHHTLTAGGLEWNILVTAYSLLGVVFEERDLIKKYGAEYLEYSKEVPAFLPSLRRL